MKKILIAALAIATLTMTVPSVHADEAPKRNRCFAGIIGCCLGIRAAGDYNGGQDISPREWLHFFPIISCVVVIWDGLDGYRGKTRSDLHAAMPSYF